MDVIGFEVSKEEADKLASELLSNIEENLHMPLFTPVAIILTWDEYSLLSSKLTNLSRLITRLVAAPSLFINLIGLVMISNYLCLKVII